MIEDHPYGTIPAFEPISDFQQGEIRSLARVESDVIKLPVPKKLSRRKLYGWIWAATSNAEYWAKAEFAFYNNNSIAGKLPLAVASASADSLVFLESIPTICVVQSVAVQDSLGIYVGQPAAGQPTNLILQPLYFTGEIDEVRVSLLSIKNVTAVRLYAAIISAK